MVTRKGASFQWGQEQREAFATVGKPISMHTTLTTTESDDSLMSA